MATYQFDREFGDELHTCETKGEQYNIGHPGESQDIGNRIEAAVPGKAFRVVCNHTTCEVVTEEAWSGEEQTALANAIAAQKAEDDWQAE